ncbi:MAG: hypothetical protein RL033_7009, partial [Pseudomonadota bacterium]
MVASEESPKANGSSFRSRRRVRNVTKKQP